MKLDNWKAPQWCIIFLILLTCTQSINAQNQNTGISVNSLRRIQIITNQYYEDCESGEICLPIENITEKLFKYAKVDIVPPGDGDYDAAMKIKIEGKAEGDYYYPEGYLYTGMHLSGKISLESKKIIICDRTFEVYIKTPSLAGSVWSPLKPCDAPFDRALYLSGSVVSKILEIIYKMHGINPLISALKDKNKDIQNSAIEALVNIGKPAVEPLIAAMRDEDSDIRKGSIDALGKLGDNHAVENIILALKEKDYGIRWRAAKALGNLGDKRAVDPLIVMLKDENKMVRWQAAKSLGEIGNIRALEPLIAAMKDEDPGVQYHVKESLKNINSKNLNIRITEIEKKDIY